jgi:hypothetical protein
VSAPGWCRAAWVLCAAACLALAAPGAVRADPAPPPEMDWFDGADAVYAAARHINEALAYDNAYNAGRLAVQWVDEYADGLFIRLRLAPQEGHQVLYEKGKTKVDPELDGARCADFMLRIEHFEDESLKTYMANDQRGPLLVATGDEADGRICVRGDGDVGVGLREVLPGRNLYNRSAHDFAKDGRGYVGGM